MFEIRTTPVFDAWFTTLRDKQAQVRIETRLFRLSLGNAGDHRHLKGGVSELRIDTGPGYRVYYCLREQTVYVLLCGGDKRTQQADIEAAQAMVEQLKQQEKTNDKSSNNDTGHS